MSFEDNDSEDENATKIDEQHNASEHRKAQEAVFRAYITKQAEDTTERKIKPRDAVQTAKDEDLSIKGLLAKQESAKIINDPREYQLELFERAKSQNTIAVLDTGSGKTLIAVLLIRHIIDQELEDRQHGKEPRIAFFLVSHASSWQNGS